MRTLYCVTAVAVTAEVPFPVRIPVSVTAPVPPLATSSVPVRSRVDPDPLVVSPVLPPLIFTTPEEGETLPESALIVVIAPAPDPTDFHVALPEESLVRT